MELEYVFVYGVFRDAYNNLLGESIYCCNAFVHGKIYKVSEFYPGYKRSSVSDRVYGDVYLIHPSVFPELDEFEGDEYERRKVWTSMGEECWVYEFKYPTDGFKEIRAGDWILR